MGGVEFERSPSVFSAPRFTFPFTLLGRPFPNLCISSPGALRGDEALAVDEEAQVRTEFFGSICFKHMSHESTLYGYISYLNRIGSIIIRLCDGKNSVNGIAQILAEKYGVTITFVRLTEFLSKLLSIGLIRPCTDLVNATRRVELLEKVWETKERRLTAPLRLYLNITRRCNLRCRHCYANAGRGASDLDRALVEKLLIEASELKIPSVVLIGGEPFLYHDFVGLVRYANQMKVSNVVTTNGMLISREYAEKLSTAGMKVIAVSVDGATAASHDFIRGKGSFDRTWRGVANCRKAGIEVCVSTTFTSRTIGEAPALIDMAVSRGVIDFHFMIFSPVGRGKEEGSLVPDKDAILGLKAALEDSLRKHSGITINCTGAIMPEVLSPWQDNFAQDPIARFIYTGCEAARFRCDVGFDGYILPCVLLDAERFQGGHISQESIKEVWQNSAIFRTLGIHGEGDKVITCRDCRGYAACLGGCRGVVYANFGDLSREYPSCSHVG